MRFLFLALFLIVGCKTPKELSSENVEKLVSFSAGTKMTDRWFGAPYETGYNADRTIGWRIYKTDTSSFTILYEIDNRMHFRNAFVWGDTDAISRK